MYYKTDEEKLIQVRQKLIEAEDFIKSSPSINERLKRYIEFLIVKHDLLLSNLSNEKLEEVNEIPLIRM